MTKKPMTFTKMVASGNDFVVIDNRKNLFQPTAALVREICERHTGIGADGILLFEKSRKADFKMRIINSDGSEAEACGNGFRCISLYAKKVMGYSNQFKFDSLAGIIKAKITGQNISVSLTKPFGLKEGKSLEVLGYRLPYSFINTGVPHAVILISNLAQFDVTRVGNAIRFHKDFKPKGTNVNFVQILGKNKIEVRTYERGVEEETLACGTGSTASAIVSVLSGSVKAPVLVKTRGGEILKINFKRQRKEISNVTLEGTAKIVYAGDLHGN